MIAIVDLGIGNYSNVGKSMDAVVTRDIYALERANKLVVPGVGNFGAVLKALEPLKDVLLDSIAEGKAFLGICLGLHLLFETSEESDGRGLGIFHGKVVKIRGAGCPHIGWNQVHQQKQCPVFQGIKNDSYFYFVHSYYALPEEDIITAITTYNGIEFASAICKDNIFAVQFHPEKSGTNGLRLLSNFRRL